MNLLENYILPGYQVRKIPREEVPFEYDGEGFIEFKGKVNCYGNIQRVRKIFSAEEWAVTKKQGHYMG